MNEIFYNRTRERRVFKEVVASQHSELFIIYGRRGAGKSALLEQALSANNTPIVYYRATRRTPHLQLEALTTAVREAYPQAFLQQPFASFSVFLNFLSYLAAENETAGTPPIVAVIDELPYIASVDPGLLTDIQHWWDENKRRPNLKLFLTGSYMSFMERQVLSVNAPLYNRRTGAMKLDPMDYAEASLFFPHYSPRAKMETYAILGGMPSYLSQFDPIKSIEENVKSTILKRNTYLSEEPDWLLLEDLRNDTICGSILQAIAKGERKPSDIAQAIGKHSAQDITPALETLRHLGLIVREVPITERRHSRSRNSLYWISDAYIEFWYRFADPSRSMIARGLGERIWDQIIEANLQQHISRPTFERACRQYLWRALEAGKLPAEIHFAEIGTWWGARDKEIDVVAVDAADKTVLAGTCKWTNALVDVAEYATLLADLKAAAAELSLDTSNIGTANGPWLVIFSKTGFTARLIELAASQQPQRLLLVTLERMYDV